MSSAPDHEKSDTGTRRAKGFKAGASADDSRRRREETTVAIRKVRFAAAPFAEIPNLANGDGG